MSEVVRCPACGGPAKASRVRTNAAGEPALTSVADEEQTEKIAQLREVVRVQKERLEAASQRIRDLEEILRQGSGRPGTTPAAPPARPGFPSTPFQGRSGAF